MSMDIRIVETDQPTFKILKWIGAGGFGQVFKVYRNEQVVACKQIQADNLGSALSEIQHMTRVRGGPHIAAVHDGLEWNTKTKSLSFFMDYYKGKDLDRQVQILRAAGERFTETQIIDIAYQIAAALEYCHSKSILHQDIKCMNVLLGEPWDPITQETVPSLYLADFGIASHVQTIGTRMTGARGTPGYEAPEIRGQGPAAFSQKSDIYALGCILFRLCTLSDPSLVEDFKPLAISDAYSIDLLSIVSAMLAGDRQSRPTATEIKQYLMAHIHENVSPTAKECRTCRRVFLSNNKFRKHLKDPKPAQGQNGTASKAEVPNIIITERPVSTLWTDDAPLDFWADEGPKFRTEGSLAKERTETRIKEMAGIPDDRIVLIPEDQLTDDKADPTPCAVCLRQNFKSKKAFFQHLHRVHHYRNPKFVHRRLVESNFFLEGPEQPMLLLEDTPESKIKGPKTRKRDYEDDNHSIGPKRQKQRT